MSLRGWLVDQLRRIAAETLEPAPRSIRLAKLNAAPAKLYDGLIVFADGTNWNPGGGQGTYIYYASAWNKLG
jgi:hypothetical protein